MNDLIPTIDPIWPWPILALTLGTVAVLVTGLTVWTYLGVPGANSRRISVLLTLRLLALLLACLTFLRPALALRKDLYPPAVLIVAADASESMTIQDELRGQSRWQNLLRVLDESEPILRRLHDEYNIDVKVSRFAGDVRDFDALGQADGKRTDFGRMLQSLYETNHQERSLAGLLILSDGADNGMPDPVWLLAEKWRNLPCPIHAFGFGKTTTQDRLNDIAVVSIHPEPSPVMRKGELTVKGIVDAPGFANSRVRVRLLLDDREVASEDQNLALTAGNEVSLKCTAPDHAGEFEVTLKVDPLPGEALIANNEMSTYVTVVKGGLSVLLIDTERFPEPQLICDALRLDPRINLHTVWLRGKVGQAFQPAGDAQAREPAPPGDLFKFDKQHYDVIIVGDVTADRLRATSVVGRAANVPPQDSLATITSLVREQGTGFLMLGGDDGLGRTWQRTAIAGMLSAEISRTNRIEGQVKLKPTEAGLRHFVMRLADQKEESLARWNRLPPLDGVARLGMPKPLSVILAESDTGVPILLGQDYGAGRTLALAADTTYLWRATPEGVESHARFWRQVVLWLGRQEEAEGNAWIKPEARRVSAGQRLRFSTGLRGKSGIDLKDARFETKVIGPDRMETPVPTTREQDEERGIFWKTDEPGEYRVVVTGKGKDVDGQEISSEASARFLVYQDEAELAKRAADHDFLKKLAAAGGGKLHAPDDLAPFLEELIKTRQTSKSSTAPWPNWRTIPRSHSRGEQIRAVLRSGMLPCLVLFITLLGLEWALRRRWGLA